jgi:hypothetical protein
VPHTQFPPLVGAQNPNPFSRSAHPADLIPPPQGPASPPRLPARLAPPSAPSASCPSKKRPNKQKRLALAAGSEEGQKRIFQVEEAPDAAVVLRDSRLAVLGALDLRRLEEEGQGQQCMASHHCGQPEHSGLPQRIHDGSQVVGQQKSRACPPPRPWPRLPLRVCFHVNTLVHTCFSSFAVY